MTGFVSVTVGISVGIYSLFLLSVSGQAQSTPALEKGPHQTATVHRQEQRVLLESTKRAVITESVEQDGSKTIRFPQRFLQGLPQPPAKGTEAAADPLAAILAYGWQEYDRGNYSQAKVFFLQVAASENTETRRNAEYGLIYSYLKLGETDAALPLLQNFVARDELLEWAAPALAGILFGRGDIAALQALLPKLSPAEGKEWQERIVFARLQNDLLSLNASSRQDELKNVLEQYRFILAECRQQEQLFHLAALLVTSSPDPAKKIFAELRKCLPDDPQWQERVLREQLRLMSDLELLAAPSAPIAGTLSESTWKRLLLETMWQRLEQFQPEDAAYNSFAQALYEQDSDNPEAASMAAWSCYQRGEYDCAGNIFSTMMQAEPTDDALLGLAYTLQKKGEASVAMNLLDQHPDRKSERLNQLRHDLHATLGGDLYRNKDYQEAAAHLEQALILQPGNVGLTEMLLWSRYHLGESKPLVDFLWQQYREQGDADTARSLSHVLGALEDPVFTKEVMARFAESETADVRKIAGDHAFQQNHPVLADQIYREPGPYAGSADPALDTMFHFRSKGGDEGTSSLRVAALLVKQRISSYSGKTWSIVISPLSVESGTLPADVPVGSVFRSPDQSQVRPGLWNENASAWGWRVGMQIEGDLDWDIAIGTTPVNGVVSPTLAGKVQGGGSDWKIAVARDSVKDSMLSWLGQTDPYSGSEWGRVVETSVGGSKTISFNDWWLAFEGAYGWYDGKRVEQNSSLTASVSGGYTKEWVGFERSVGLFLFGRGFERNSNFYTFGHGGYYSPAEQVIAGPFFRIVTPSTAHYWLEASCSAGLNYRRTDDAPRYAELGAVDIGPEDPGWNDLLGTYAGESGTGLGLDARVRGFLPLSNGWFVGGDVSINNVADFTQWQGAVVLRYRFGEGMGLGVPERDISMLTRLIQ
jgi:tetratricopeptide (TPR) repeat protein